ncbi:Dam family site-specific DNA-(adenine-N6)-methyltransferase [Escherichia coli]|uniref:DNA adenine methylase n=1 Tax=Escherichia coli TaxID=562 RepID=UPI000696322B|nr:Dam family site-specific DNA-(adenine-N6)-methyltransferase [Escherichia coli]EEV9022305.1 Dam family site-specific DNA-(adenine-N6)-methyltransferase [Escherichia coli]EEY5871461.1 Dam family site-specific DNA-(adenine-N6)-methyltransferase [Escherichia coli]EEZ0154361.1 Dam family site-specific DNA-(adenine-N6)-methyltransferase [Escherichia coli]EEZ4493484.1 Dam family site-specific DNA-(adenine-N6)-methyltransferase [Escherichia coli]EFA3517508.1 Dam family site-specific DNA-(adenine-N6
MSKELLSGTPLKWVGGKSRIMNTLKAHLPEADCLVEPFVGGASVFMNTSYSRYILGDSNGALINFCRAARDNTDCLINEAKDLFLEHNNRTDYLAIRNTFNAENHAFLSTGISDRRELRLAAMFLYLNRHCFNGLYRVNEKGDFNVPFGGYRAPYFPEREIRAFADKANSTRTLLVHGDFQKTLNTASHLFSIGSTLCVYCDPPYLSFSGRDNFTAYEKPFTKDEHVRLRAALDRLSQETGGMTSITISGSDTPEARRIYQGYRMNRIQAPRSVGAKTRKPAPEVIATLRQCDACGRHGGGYCPDCGTVTGDTTYSAMFTSSTAEQPLMPYSVNCYRTE